MGTFRPKSKQGNTTNLNSSLFKEKGAVICTHNNNYTVYEANAPPTELPRQLSLLGQIKGIQVQPV